MSRSDVSLSVSSNEDHKSLMLPAHQDVRSVSVAPLAITKPTILTLSPSMVDPVAMDNHSLLLRYWQAIPPARKWILFLGAALGLSLTGRMLLSPSVIPFVPLASSSQHAIDRTQTAFNSLYQTMQKSLSGIAVNHLNYSGATIPVSAAIQPSLKPMMVDRFYLVGNAQVAAQENNPQPTVVVDRYYFYSHDSSISNPAPNNPQAPAPLGIPSRLRVPVPPAVQLASGVQPPSLPSSGVQLSSTQPMLPSLAEPQSPTALMQHPPLASASAQYPRLNRLMGIIQAGQLTAAMVQTEDNSYVVKLGDRLSQSSFRVIDIQSDFIVLGNGTEELTIRVGDTF